MFKRLFTAFKAADKELVMVGGAVRDKIKHVLEQESPLSILSDEFHFADVDFATSAKPKETMKILKKEELPAIPIGFAFGTIQTIIDGIKVEIFWRSQRGVNNKFFKSINIKWLLCALCG